MMPDPNYEQRLICENCMNFGYYKIPRGTTIVDYTKAEVCRSCSCANTLRRA